MSSLLEVEGLSKEFPVHAGLFGSLRGPARKVHALTDVSLSVASGETLGVVGESGSGKSTLGRCILRLIEPTRGQVRFQGQELTTLPAAAMRTTRRQLQIVFQDPYSSLNPRMTVRATVGEALRVHRLTEGGAAEEQRVVELLDQVGLRREFMRRYPHELSGGQRQRV
ncbi:MAG TPA: dipeptide/oligopeptide/nickel ABC transporter ATP-binding protein, partial [Polyangiales bacterium]